MADDDDNVESKPSSLGIISDFLSSFTSAGSSDSATENTQSREAEQTTTDSRQTSHQETNENTTDVESIDDDGIVERRQSSLERITDFFSSFTSAGSEDDSCQAEGNTADAQDTGDSVRDSSSDLADQNTSEAVSGTAAEDDAVEEHRQSSLEKISDFLSGFTYSGTSPSSDQPQVDNQAQQQQQNENAEHEDVILIDDDSEGIGSEGRLRSSTSRIFTEPETIDKKDLDYVTLVSS